MPEGEGTTRTLETPELGENEWGDEDDVLQEEDEIGDKDDNASEFIRPIRMKPFFGPDTKYGYCPYCAAVIIFNEKAFSLNNEDNIVKCHNCEAKLEVKMEDWEN